MKILTKPFALFAGAALLCISTATAVTTDPVGYVTETISSGTFNVIGANLASPVSLSGVLDGSTTNTVVDSEADFIANLSEDGEYVIKLTNGTGSGVSTTVTATSSTSLTTGGDISSFVVDGTTTYEIRKSLTVADVFGANNSVELKGGNGGSSSADIVWIPDGIGGFNKVFYNAVAGSGFGALSVGWKDTSTGNSDASNTPIYFTDSMLIQVQRAAFDSEEAGVDAEDLTKKDIVLVGSVITSDTQSVILTGFNYINRIFPGNMTLAQSNFEDVLAQGVGGSASADIIWVPNGSGGYNKYFYNGTAGSGFGALSVGWKSTATGNNDVKDDELTSGFIIQRRGAPTLLTVPNLTANL